MGRAKHGGHGGSWKVAYADFVTSMMALFLVLWIVSEDIKVREAIQDYFRGTLKKPAGEGIMNKAKVGPRLHKNMDFSDKEILMLQELQRSTERLEQILKNSRQIGDDMIRFEYLADGVRITAIDRSKRPFFIEGTAVLTGFGEWVLETIAWEIERYPFLVEVEGHTQQGAESGEEKTDPDGWNLSTFRAIAAKDKLEDGGIIPGRFWRVAGYGNRIPIDPEHPEAEGNRRISIVIRAGNHEELYKIPEDTSSLNMNPTL